MPKPAIADTGGGPFRPGRLIPAALVVMAVAVVAAAAMFAVEPEDASAQGRTSTIEVVTYDRPFVEGQEVDFHFLAHPRPSENLTIRFNVTQTGNFAAAGQLGNRTVTMTPRGYAIATVETVDDSVNEAEGTIKATIRPGSNYRITSEPRWQSATARVKDNDVPVVQISGGSAVSEGGTANFQFKARPKPASPFPAKVTVTQSGNFAASGDIGQKTVTIGTNGSGTLQVDTQSDQVDEDDGTITATLNTGDGYKIGSPASAKVAVSDGGDPTPRISVSGPASIQEGETVTFTVKGQPAPVAPVAVSVNLTEQGSFASAGEISNRTVTVGTDGSSTFTVATTNDRTAEPDGTITATVVGAAGYLVGTPSQAAVTVRDTTPAVTIAAGPAIDEGGTATFTLTSTPALSPGFDANVVVSQNGDFVNYLSDLGQRTVSIGADGSGSFTIDTYDDTTLEANGAITARVTSGAGYGVGTPSSASVSVADTTPRVSVSAGPTVIEGQDATFTVTANPAPAATLYVDVNVSETGSFATSGETGIRSITIDATTGQATFTVTTDNDQVEEENGSVTARVEASTQSTAYYGVGSPRSASVTVNDNDPGPAQRVMVSIGDATVVESSAPGTQRTILEFPVTISQARPATITYDVRATTATATTAPATEGVDFRDVPPNRRSDRRLGFIGGETKRMLQFEVLDDDLYEPKPETFEVVITNVANGEIVRGRATGTIVDDPLDAPRGTPTVTIRRSGTASVTEGGVHRFELSANPMPKHDVLVTVHVTSDTGDDFLDANEEGNREVMLYGLDDLAFKGRKGTSTRSFTVQTDDDGVWEEDGAIRVTVEADPDRDAGGEYDVSADQYEATANVKDNDRSTPVVTIRSYYPTVEGRAASFELRAEPAPAQDLDVQVTVQELSGDFVAAADEGTRTVTIPGVDDATFAKWRHTLHFMTVPTVDDRTIESSGQVQITIQLDPDGDYDANTQPYSAIVVVSDNDNIPPEHPLVKYSDLITRIKTEYIPNPNYPGEPHDLRRVLKTLGDPDYVDYRGGKVGRQEAINRRTRPSDNPHWEGVAEAIEYAARYAPPAGPSVSISADSDVTEGDSATFTLTADPTPGADLVVSVAVSQSGDYGVSTGTRTVTIPSSGSATLTVATSDDQIDEADGSVTAAVQSGNRYRIGSPGSATATVYDDDIIEVSISAGSDINEGGSATFTLDASPAPVASLDVSVAVSQSGEYGVTTGTRTVTIPSSGSATLTVATGNDGIDEADGSVTAAVQASNGYTVGFAASATVLVADDDTATVSVSGPDGKVLEGGDVTFTITADPTPALEVLVYVTVSTPNNDYVDYSDTGAFSVTIPAGAGSATFDVATDDDSVEETGDGTVTLTIDDGGAAYTVASAPDNAATATVRDNDGQLTVSVDDAEAQEGRSVKVRVWLSKPATEEVSVIWGTTSQIRDFPRATASGRDYTSRSGTFRFREGEVEKIVSIQTTSDQVDDPDEFFYIRLRNPRPADELTILDGVGKATIR